jgi:GNAT superfamily N-acetyltransferase
VDIEYRDQAPSPEDFVRLFETTGWNLDYRLTADELAAALGGSTFAVSAYQAGRAVGCGRVVSDGTCHALIVDVIVDPAVRGRGIGRAMLERLTAECRRRGIRDVQLFCAAGQRGFYERLGFVVRPDEAPGMELPR